MGIIADVNLHQKENRDYLEIIVEKYPSLISYHGKYYYRSGSTMREITGKELEKTLLKTQGRTWDGIALPKLKISDLKKEAIDFFKEKAIMRGRLTKEELDVEDDILLDNLRLIDEDGYLCRAAMPAFFKDPEKWVFGAYIKIGFFGKSDSDLIYQDEIHGSLIEQVDKTLDLIYTKYLKALIYYKGIQRVEQFMFHKDALREILLNAVVHKDYRTCNPIQISVYNDKIYVYNDGEMPVGLDSTEKLFSKHSSKPFNPVLANVIDKKSLEKTSIPKWVKFQPEGWYSICATADNYGNAEFYYLYFDADAEFSRIGNDNTELDIKDSKVTGSISEVSDKNIERFNPCKTPSWAKSYNPDELNGWYKIWTNPDAFHWNLFYVYFNNKEKITRVGLKDYELTEEYYDFKQIIYGWEHNYYEKNDFASCSAPSWSGNSSSSGSENDSDKSDDSGNSENENNKGYLSHGWYRITTTYEGVSTTNYFYFDENGELQRAGNDRQEFEHSNPAYDSLKNDLDVLDKDEFKSCTAPSWA
ncbi:MAG: hypothetical protein MR260_05760 [Spirochaetia bacterium]|nr:hypothetical protein [Spirochaetia bacterium]